MDASEIHKFSTLIIVFDAKVEIVHSSFKIDEQTFVTRLGGSVSSGRTLLWILLGLLGTFEVNQRENSFMVYTMKINTSHNSISYPCQVFYRRIKSQV